MTTPFWYSWPSWRTEILSGIGTVTLAVILLWVFNAPIQWKRALVLSIILAFAYELWFDKNGFELKDVMQRAVGIALIIVPWMALN